MTQDELERERLESACFEISRVLHQLLKEKKIDALEFLSIVGHMPIKLSELNLRKWNF
ncbi:MAG: hypothetical protein HC769_34070 [Cyanobacteria bacterium CRU_2_1]|nr:hypothetical protein [Cyanobacteria bacterium RU_5_0]NJR63366.1 hypothetical protein [Cyanobacteria bacterium CRU_2_1]